MTDLRERLAAAVGGKAALASSFSVRTMRNLEERAEREIESAAKLIEETLEGVELAVVNADLFMHFDSAASEELATKLIAKWAAYQHAGARTANPMVTGPANFPADRNRKRIDTEMKRLGEYLDFAKAAAGRAVQNAKRARDRAIGPAGVVDAELQDLRKRLEERELSQRLMKASNEMIRRHKLSVNDLETFVALMAERGFTISQTTAHAALKPNYMGRIGFESFQLSNNNAEIKRLQARIADVERKAASVEADAPAAERVEHGVRVIEDPVDDRLRLVFDGKPEPQVITLLKSRGFKWSPRNTAWQRQLTANARGAAQSVLSQIGAMA